MQEQGGAKRTIPVTVEKSHLVTIGEKLYAEKTSFIRELANNAYDADATIVRVEITEHAVSITDNGSGMDEAGLTQYFAIGSSLKKSSDISPRFHRKRIGEFGIGKFAALAACSRFAIETERGVFRARLSFDKEAWLHHEDWHLDIDLLPSQGKDGTTITLHNPTITLLPGRVRRYLAERTPIHAPDFAVFVNGERVSDDMLTGAHKAMLEQTPYGKIHGTLVIVPEGKKIAMLGIAVHVKGVLIRYEQFGLTLSRKWGAGRITGRVHADFLPVTSSRDDFVRDSDEFMVFEQTMQKEVTQALRSLRSEGDRKADLEASRVLKDALQKIGKAMRRHKGLFPHIEVPVGEQAPEGSMNAPSEQEEEERAGTGFQISQAQFAPSGSGMDDALKQSLAPKGKSRGRPRAILGAKSVVRRITFAGMDIAVRLEHMGEQDESLLSGGIIYVNLDHPLYQTYRGKDDFLAIHLARVITKELTLHAGISSAADAFALQSELLTDALKEKRGAER